MPEIVCTPAPEEVFYFCFVFCVTAAHCRKTWPYSHYMRVRLCAGILLQMMILRKGGQWLSWELFFETVALYCNRTSHVSDLACPTSQSVQGLQANTNVCAIQVFGQIHSKEAQCHMPCMLASMKLPESLLYALVNHCSCYNFCFIPRDGCLTMLPVCNNDLAVFHQ